MINGGDYVLANATESAYRFGTKQPKIPLRIIIYFE